ncbi:hypothetical protein [Nonomuraea sp. NPDC003201]
MAANRPLRLAVEVSRGGIQQGQGRQVMPERLAEDYWPPPAA